MNEKKSNICSLCKKIVSALPYSISECMVCKVKKENLGAGIWKHVSKRQKNCISFT